MEENRINTTYDQQQQQQHDDSNNNNSDDDNGYDQVDGKHKDRILSVIVGRAGRMETKLFRKGNNFLFKVTTFCFCSNYWGFL